MSRLMIIALLLLARPVQAEAPSVVTDIAPVQSLVALVMQGVGTPALIVPPGASPHGYAMRPSEARALAGADLVIWIGPSLTRWLAEPIATLAPDATKLVLMEMPGLTLLPFRQEVGFPDHGHDHSLETDQDADHDTEEGAQDGIDPHLWLDPRNGALWLEQIAQALAALDPGNAATYRANAAAGQAALSALEQNIATRLTPLRDAPFIVYHDGFHYFEARFGVEARAAISDSDATTPGAARVGRVQDLVRENGAVCGFVEPQFNAGLLETVVAGQGMRTAILDPFGSRIEPGPALYSKVLEQMADEMETCLAR